MKRGQTATVVAELENHWGATISVEQLMRACRLERRQVQAVMSYVRNHLDMEIQTVKPGQVWRLGGGKLESTPERVSVPILVEHQPSGLTLIYPFKQRDGWLAEDDRGNLYVVTPLSVS